MLNAWTIWWNADRLLHGWHDYWHAPIFYPERFTFGLSEPQPLTAVMAPLAWAFSPVVAYNVYLFCTLVLNGFCTYRLLRSLECTTQWAAVGGIAVIWHPLALHNLEAVQLTALWPLLWFFHAAVAFHRAPRFRHAAGMAVALAASCYTCANLCLVFAMCLAVGVWFVIPWRCGAPVLRRSLLLASGSIALFALLGSPILYGVWRASVEHGVERNATVVATLSANWHQWLAVPAGAWHNFVIEMPQSRRPLNPGWGRVILAAAGMIWLGRGKQATAPRFFTAMLGCSFLLAFGANLGPEGSWWRGLSDFVLPLQWMRSPYRFAFVTQLMVLLLACLTGQQIARRLAQWASTSQRIMVVRRLVVGFLMVLVAAEVLPPRTCLVSPPAVADATWLQRVRAIVPQSDAIVCVPVSPGLSEAEMEVAARWMMYQTRHRRPITNGYSGFIPVRWNRLREQLLARPFDDATFDHLRQLGVSWMVVRLGASTGIATLPEKTARKVVYQDEHFAILDLRR